VNDRHIGRLESLDDDELAALHLSLFGVLEVDGGGFAQLRLAEHAVHTWDVAVALDPAATVAPDAVDILVDSAAEVAAWVGKAPASPVRLRIDTTDPSRSYAFAAESGVAISPYSDEAVDGTMRLPAEAFLRLVYGRLDPNHTPPLELDAGDLTLDDLRAIFPGL